MKRYAQRVITACTLAWALHSGACAQDTWGAYAHIRAEAWSNGVPVLDLDGDWRRGYQPHQGEQRASISARMEAGARIPWGGDDTGWRLGWAMRADGTARLSGEAAQVLYHYQSRTDPAGTTTLDAGTRLLYWRGRGLALHSPAWHAAEGVSVEAGWDHLRLDRMRVLRTDGSVAYDAGDGSYGYRGALRDDDVRATTPFMAPAARHGTGDALSLQLTLAPRQWVSPSRDDAWRGAVAWVPSRVTLAVDDAWSRLSWSGVNGNDAVLDSNVSQRDQDGHIEYRAAINGQYTRRTVVERIPVQSRMRLDWDREENGTWQLRLQQRLGLWQRWVGWESATALRASVAVEPVAKALQLGVAWRGLQATVMGDRTDQAAHLQAVQMSVLWPL